MHLFKSIYCDVDLAPRQTRGGGTQESTEAGVTAHALGQGPSRPPASPPPGGVGGRGGLHTGAWRDGALASDPGTRRSRRTERNCSEMGGSETEGRTPGVKPDATSVRNGPVSGGRVSGLVAPPFGGEGARPGQHVWAEKAEARAEETRKTWPERAGGVTAWGRGARGQRPSAEWGDLSDESSPGSDTHFP